MDDATLDNPQQLSSTVTLHTVRYKLHASCGASGGLLRDRTKPRARFYRKASDENLLPVLRLLSKR